MCFYSYKHLWCLVSNIIFHENIHTTKQHCFSCLRPSYVNKNLENLHHNWSKETFWGALWKTFVTFVYIQNFTQNEVYPLYKLAISCDQNLCESCANVISHLTNNVNCEHSEWQSVFISVILSEKLVHFCGNRVWT